MKRLLILALAIWIVETVGCNLHPAHGGVLRDPLTIRKLHLMRPDLIFFPLDWRVYA